MTLTLWNKHLKKKTNMPVNFHWRYSFQLLLLEPIHVSAVSVRKKTIYCRNDIFQAIPYKTIGLNDGLECYSGRHYGVEAHDIVLQCQSSVVHCDQEIIHSRLHCSDIH